MGSADLPEAALSAVTLIYTQCGVDVLPRALVMMQLVVRAAA
jgi:hypothetical protein